MDTIDQTVQTEFNVVLRADEKMQAQLRQTSNAVTFAESFLIDCAEQAQLAADERRDLAGRIDKLEDLRKGFLAPAQQIIENAKSLFNPGLTALKSARDILGAKLLTWDQQEKARIAAETAARETAARKIRQEAEAKAAADRARAEEQSRELRRKEQEAAAAAERARAEGNARAAAAAEAAAAKAREAAQAAIENGQAKAEAAEAEAAAKASAIEAAAPEVAKVAGSTVKDNWIAELNPGVTEDQAKALIVAAIVNEKRQDLLAILQIDTAARGALNKLAAAQKKVMSVPGYSAVNKPSLAGSRK